MASKPDLSIIIINRNTKTHLEKCLNSVYRTVCKIPYEIILVDNGSTDGSVEMVKNQFPGVVLIENKKNLGFAKANNQAFKTIKDSMYILLLNSDVFLSTNNVQEMIAFLRSSRKAGAAGPALCFPNGTPQKGGGYNPSFTTAFNHFLFLSVLFPRHFKGLFVDQRPYRNNRSPVHLDWVAATCLLIKKEVLDTVGGFDESFFLYAEDVEWCERIRKAGWEIFYLPYVELTHYQGASSMTYSGLWIKSLIQYIKTRNGLIQALIFRSLSAFGLGIRSFYYSIFYIITNKKYYFDKAQQTFVYLKAALS